MKKSLFVLSLVGLLIISGLSFACDPSKVYRLDGNCWTALPSFGETNNTVEARAFTSFEVKTHACDRPNWYERIQVHASVAQWISYKFSASRWDWQIRKPGTFMTDGCIMNVQSNADVTFTPSGFEDLKDSDGNTINIEWALTGTNAKPNSFETLTAWNTGHTLAYNDVKAANGHDYYLWNKIIIKGDTKVGEYDDIGLITLSTVTPIKPFIDGNTGINNNNTNIGNFKSNSTPTAIGVTITDPNADDPNIGW